MSTKGEGLDENDRSRLVAALQAAFSSSFPLVTSPMNMTLTDKRGLICLLDSYAPFRLMVCCSSSPSDMDILRTHLHILGEVFKFEIWQSSVFSSSAGDRVCWTRIFVSFFPLQAS